MNRCKHCGHYHLFEIPTGLSAENQDKDCPNVIPTKLIPVYRRGWDDGFLGRPEGSRHEVYVFGYGRGLCAAEEAENGYCPVKHGE